MFNTGIRSAGGRDEGGGDILFLETFECVMIGDVSNVLGYYTTFQDEGGWNFFQHGTPNPCERIDEEIDFLDRVFAFLITSLRINGKETPKEPDWLAKVGQSELETETKRRATTLV